MAVLKCRMCGGDIAVTEEMSVADCARCGARQTVPLLDSGKKLILFSRAIRLLLACEFDKAAGAYQDIAAEFPAEAEAYWGLLLCRYGISYIDGPEAGKKLPACHRISHESVLDDADYERALENADPPARRVYREEAKAIEAVRRNAAARSANQPPCDVFVCHEETGENAALVQGICGTLAREGFQVFSCPSPLDAASSAAYEPAVFAALNSARVMLVFGSSCERFNAVWVKNAWSRFLTLIGAGQERSLIPCYQNISARDLPKEFAGLEFHDMGRAGAMESLLLQVVELVSASPRMAGGLAAAPPEAPPEHSVQYFLGRREAAARIALLIAAGDGHTAAVRADGKVIAVGYTGDGQCSVASWRDAIAVAADAGHTVALRSDGTVLAAGKNDFGQCNVAGWTDIVSITVGASYTVGVRSDGTVVAAGKNDYGQCHVAGWTDIMAAAADVYRTIGLKTDGSVVVTGWTTSLYKSKAIAWRDIVGVSSSSYHTVGWTEEGAVTVLGGNGLPDWKDIVFVSAGPHHTVGLKLDGTVVAAGDNQFGQCEVSGWRDMIAVSAGIRHTVGLRLDGTVAAVGDNRRGQCEVQEWKLFSDLAAWEENVTAAGVRRQKREVLCREQAELKKELLSLKGLFTGKRRKEIEERLGELDAALDEIAK